MLDFLMGCDLGNICEKAERKTENVECFQMRDETNVTNDDVCCAYLRPICADMTHSPRENPPPTGYFGFQYAFGGFRPSI
jgi:hypothetical protein